MTYQKLIDINNAHYHPASLIAVSKVFARAVKQMNIREWKAFIFALTKIKWTETNPSIVYLDKNDLADLLGIHTDSKRLSAKIFEEIKDMVPHSHIIIKDRDSDFCDSGTFIKHVTTRQKGKVIIQLEEDYMKLFQNLNGQNPYITMWSGDLFQMKSERAILFYESLRLNSDTRVTNSKVYSTKELKELFNMPRTGKGSYMKFSPQKNTEVFDRANFERYVLLPVFEDLKKCKMINIVLTPSGRYWIKEKDGNSVLGYRISWTVRIQKEDIENSVATEKENINQNGIEALCPNDDSDILYFP